MKIRLSFVDYLALKQKANLISVDGHRLELDDINKSSRIYKKYSILKIKRSFNFQEDAVVVVSVEKKK